MIINAEHELYKDFLEYAQGQGMYLDEVQEMYDRTYENAGMDREALTKILEFEGLMYDYLGVKDAYYDNRLHSLLEAPGIYEINHPHNFRSKD